MTNDPDYSQFASIGHNGPTESDLELLSKWAEEQLSLEKEVEECEQKLKKAKEKLDEVSERRIPQKMEDIGIQDYTTKSGIKVSVKEEITAAIKKENRPKAHNWLEENGLGSIVKSTVVISYGRSELEAAKKLVNEYLQNKRAAKLERKVEPMTLTSVIKERIEQGKEVPESIFSVYRQRVSKIKVKKEE